MVRIQVAEPSQVPVSPHIDDELRLLGHIAAGVLHDLNNYLGAIHATLTLFERWPDERELVSRALGCVQQAGRLTTALLGYVRGEDPVFEAIELGALVRRTLSLIEPSFSHRIAVRVEIAEALAPVRGVASELEQLVLNLVINAADAMPGGGELVVRALPTEGNAVYLEVSDTGSGIEITPLGAGDAATGSSKDGRRRGLGLGIAQRVVDHHGGALAIAPRRDGAGTLAIVFLPAAAPVE